MKIELDYFEYASNVAAQAAYVASTEETVDQQQTDGTSTGLGFGNVGGQERRLAQSFQLSGDKTVIAVEVYCLQINAGPTGNWTLNIDTDSSGIPSNILANANATITDTPPGAGTAKKYTFATPFTLLDATTYHIVVLCNNQENNKNWDMGASDNNNPYANGNMSRSIDGGATWVAYYTDRDLYFKIYTKATQVQSEATIKQQGNYSLNIKTTIDSLNSTLTRTVSPTIDLSGQTQISYYIRASRTGSNVKISIHDSGGTTTEITPNVTDAGTWQKVIWDISAVADVDKNAIDQIKITIVNADADNNFFLDDMYGFKAGGVQVLIL